MTRLGFVALLALAGCAGAPTAPQAAPSAFTAESLQKLAAHKVTDVSGVIGAPSSHEPVAGGTAWVWNTASMDSTFVPTPVQTAGFISSLPKGADATGGGGQTMDREVKCKVRVDAGNDGYIQHIDFNGSHAACDSVKTRLANWINQVG